MSPDDFLRLVENASGLLLERENGVYSFAHLTFQEYLAAAFLVERRWGKWLLKHIGMTWWQETIRLYCAMADATSIIAECLKEDRPSVSIVELAIYCDEEAREVQPKVRTRLETLLKQGIEDSEPERQHVIAGALLTKRLRGMIHLKEETYTDTSFITCAEYQVFIDEQRARGRYFQPDHWTSYHFPLGQGNAPVLGVRSSDAKVFCDWLTEREHGSWIYRLPETGELEDERITSKLQAGTCYWLNDGKRVAWTKEPLVLPKNVRQKLAKQVRTRVLTGDIDLTNDLALARNLDKELSDKLNLICDRDYARTRTRTLDHGRELADALARALEHAMAFEDEHSVQITPAYDLTNQLIHRLTTARDLSSAIDADFSRNQELTAVFNQAYELDRALSRELDRVRELLIADYRDRARQISPLSRLQDQTQKQVLFDIHYNSSIIGNILDRAQTLEYFIADDLERAQEFTNDRTFELTRSYARAIYLTESWEKPSSRRGLWQLFHFGQTRKRKEDELHHFIESVLNIYTHLVILDERIHGKLPACESILIMKSRN